MQQSCSEVFMDGSCTECRTEVLIMLIPGCIHQQMYTPQMPPLNYFQIHLEQVSDMHLMWRGIYKVIYSVPAHT